MIAPGAIVVCSGDTATVVRAKGPDAARSRAVALCTFPLATPSRSARPI